ncbi:MAG: arginyl-tRNA synthetase [Thermoleophilaceae bacterium]|nr:arginyl-tRNA synthetase [Thermoleophilaceae bacterium]
MTVPADINQTADPVAELQEAVLDAAAELADAKRPDNARLSRPPKPDFGDYSSNAPMLLAPLMSQAPREVAGRLGEAVTKRLGDDLERADVAGPGFLNLYMSEQWFRQALARIASAGDDYGRASPDQPERIQVEFVSANPTGPANAATGRHAAFGDSLARILQFAGHDVQREYYVNDYGGQVRRFGESIQARARGEEPPEDGYQGEYVADLAKRIDGAAEADPEQLARTGVELMIEEVRATLERYRVHFDRFFRERDLHEAGAVERAVELLREHGHVYESEGATWLRTTTLGDDKDRVLKRSDGDETYLASDIAYHEDKRERGFDRIIDVWGADHHGHVARMHAAWEALGGDRDRLELVIMQLVNLMEGGQRFQSSKRSGTFVTLDELIDDIGVDAARFFMLQRSHDTTLDLDLKLARDQSQENPVYYVQYAHARIASILRKAGEGRVAEAVEADLGAVAGGAFHPSASALLKQLLEFPEETRIAAERRAPHRMTTYSLEVARSFSAFYRDCQVVGGEDEDFRITLSVQARRVIARALDLLGVEAPDSM